MQWLDFIGLFVMLTGFIIGLGAVIVIDIHGFLGRKSAYWTEATTRTHKVTKPMIWTGIMLTTIGGMFFYRNAPFVGIPLLLTCAAGMLMLNGCFLSFRVSPFMVQREKEGRAGELLPMTWQRKIMISLIISDIGWWGSLLLVIYTILSR